jgi:RHS repeat-associated protein
MKTIRILILCWLAVITANVCRAQITDPGWFRATNQPPASPTDRASFPTNSGFLPALQFVSPMQPSAPVAEVITPQIQALADGLGDNPYNIFNYVHDNINFVLYFGSKKGAELTLLEKSGNDFDQSSLLLALLKAAGYTNAQYQFGWEAIPYDDPYDEDYDLHHWWRLNLNNVGNTNSTATVNYLFDLAYDRGYPGNYYSLQDNTVYFWLQRVWVQLTIGTTTYQLDPAFKISEPVGAVSGFSLTNAMGGSSTTISNALLSAVGGTDTSLYAQSLNEANLRGKLNSYATNLLNNIQSNAPNASVQQVLNGWQIVPAYDSIDLNLPYDWFYVDTFDGQMPVLGWTYEPTNLMSTFKITFAGTNYQWYMPQLEGNRISLTFSNNGVAQLWQDDTLLAQHSTSGSGTTNVIFAVTHPIGTWNTTNDTFAYITNNFANMTVTNSYQCTNAYYAILYAFEPDWGWLQQRQQKLDTYLQEGLTNGTRQVTCESLNIMGLNWMLQTEQADQMLAGQLDISDQNFHRIGRMAEEIGNGYYVDVYMQFTGEYPNNGDNTNQIQKSNAYFDLESFFASAMEHGIIEELQNSNLVGASTVKMLQIANTNGQPVYLAYSGNWSTVQSDLTSGSYSSQTISQIGNYISQGYYVLLPQNGTNRVSNTSGSWFGYGYEARQAINGSATVSVMKIGGGYFGGYSSEPVDIDVPVVDETDDNEPTAFTETPVSTPDPTSADPVDTPNGTYQVQNTDLSVGKAEPKGITLSRYYNGTRRFVSTGGMAGGWIHNYCVTANNVAAPQAVLGGTTPQQAAAMFAATAAAVSLYNDGTPDARNWLTTALIAKWGIDQLTKSGVSVNLGKDTLQFVQQPNGVFTPPANCTATLSGTPSAYALQMRHGNKFNFNSSGYLSSIVDQYGNTLNLTYNSSNWVSTVKDWQNRHTLTFNYSGSPARLASVSDGTRTVNYSYSTAYNSQGDLTSFTDAGGNTNGYVYDTNHDITANIDGQGRVVVTNIYNTQGELMTQSVQGNTNKTWLIQWSGYKTTEFDPQGDETDYYFDHQGRLYAVVDPLDFETDTYYDGQNHVVATYSPLNEENQFFYDGNNNLTNTIDPLGFTNQFFYDGNNNLVKAIDPRGNPTTFGYNSEFSITGQTNGAGDYINYAYNSDGTLHTRADSGGTATYGYDSLGQLSSVAYPGISTNTFANSYAGDVTNQVDGRGFATAFQYNALRQLTNTIAPTNLVTKIAYDPEGNQASATDARGNVLSSSWSATRKLLGTAYPAMPQGTPVVTNIYDNRDWTIETLDPLQNSNSYVHDLDGRLILQSDPVQRTTGFRYDHDGRQIAVTNGASEVVRQTWDAKSELIKLTDGAGNNSIRSYDGAGNQIVLTNRNGNPWQFHFDAANRLTNTVSPLGRSTTVAFNHQGLPVLVTDPMLQITSNGYDAKGRLTNRADNVASTFYTYDGNDNRTSVVENGNTNLWTYDAYNRVSSYTDVYGNLIQYRYDANGNLTNLIYPGGRNVYYFFDSNNNMTNVTDWSGRKTTLTYDLDGRLTGIYRPNGTYRTISYDSAGEINNVLEQMANGLPIALMRYNWDLAARMSLDFTAPLPHTNSPPPRTMTYDNDNELYKVDNNPVSLDNDGNLLSGPLTNDTFAAYSYDARNRLRNVGGVTNYYDAVNNRIGQAYGTNSIGYVVSSRGKLPIVLERTKNSITTYYIYGHGGLLYQITETPAGTNTLTYHYDYRGSTIALTGDNGLVTDRMEYSLYGTMTYHAGVSDTPFLFAGRYSVQSDPNGLLYMQSRYYSPFLCRFVNPDPTGFKGGMNFYAYANGNPASLIDPFGLDAAPVVTANGDNITYQPAPNNSLEDVLNYTPPVEYPLLSSDIGQTETGSSLYETASTTLGTAGLAQSGLELSPLDEATIGDNGIIYWSGWGGGSRAMITTYDIAPYLKIGGNAIVVGGFLVDTYGVFNGDITPTHYFVNTGVGATALYLGGPPGAIIGGTYFIFDQINSQPNGWWDVYNDVLDGLYGPDPEDGGAGDP